MKIPNLIGDKRIAAAVAAGAILILTAGAVAVVRGCGQDAHVRSGTAVKYQCPMHPRVVQDKPGICPICHMDLVKVGGEKAVAGSGDRGAPDRRILRYRNPMDPAKFSAKPMKDSMGMDYIPVYAGDDETANAGNGVPGRAAFALSEERRQLIGVKTGVVERRALSRRLRLPGRVSAARTVTAELLEMDAGTVREGMKAVLSGPQEQTVGAVVIGVDPDFDGLTRSYAITLESAGDPAWLRPGAYCEASVILGFGKRLAVPADALLYSGERKVVFLAGRNGRFEPREVRTGKVGEDWIEVLSGLKEGDRVVVSANFLIDSESRFKSALEQFGK